MADPQRTTGDTVPAEFLAISDEKGLVKNLASAESVKLFAVQNDGDQVFGGTVKVLDPPIRVGDPASPEGFNGEYALHEGDTDVAGSYSPWVLVTWDESTTPPEREWFIGGDTINIRQAPVVGP